MRGAGPAHSAPEARAWAAGQLLQFQLAAQRALATQGIRAPVRVYLVNMYFPARRYPTGQLPAGRYDAVRIDIGSGGGRNWWCVLYPGLCSFAQGGYALPAENDLVCGQYILRFRLVDGTVLESTGSMDELARQLTPHESFLRTHRSFLVNMEYIQNISTRAVTLTTLAQIPIPHGKSAEIRRQYLEYAFRRKQVMI